MSIALDSVRLKMQLSYLDFDISKYDKNVIHRAEGGEDVKFVLSPGYKNHIRYFWRNNCLQFVCLINVKCEIL